MQANGLRQSCYNCMARTRLGLQLICGRKKNMSVCEEKALATQVLQGRLCSNNCTLNNNNSLADRYAEK